MTVQEMYQQKLTTADEAVKVVKSGDWVDYGWCCNQPVALDKALAARKDELFDVKIHGGVTMWMPEVCKADDAGDHFTWNSWHCSGIDRKIITKGMGFFGPMRYSELPRFYRDGNAKTDAFGMTRAELDAVMEPSLYIGRCRQQVERFLAECAPLLTNVKAADGAIGI